MTKKLRNIILVFFTLALIMGSMGSFAYSFAKTNKVEQSITTDFKPDKVTDLQVSTQRPTCIKLKWSNVKCATGYRIYRSTMKNGIYRKVGEVCEKTTCYIDRNLSCGTNYYYKVRAYQEVGDKICLGYASDTLDTTTCPDMVKSLRASCISNSSIELNWETVYKSSGYEVYRATSENGNFKRVATLTDKGKSCYRDKNLKSGKKYYYKVRTFKELNGQICFGCYSDILSVCTEK